MDYSVFDAIRAGFGKVVFVIRRDFEEQFRTQLGSRFEGHIQVEYAFQDLHDLPPGFTLPEGRTKPWGTAHAMLAAAGVVHEPCLMINADDFYGQDAFRIIAQDLIEPRINDGKSHYSMAGFLLKNTLSEHGSVARGICTRDDKGMLASLTEMTKIFRTAEGAENRENPGAPVKLSGNEPVSMNFFGFTPDFFDALKSAFTAFLKEKGTSLTAECYVPSVVNDLIRDGKADVRVIETSGKWFGVTYPEDKAEVVGSIKALVDSGEYPSPLWG